MTNLGKNIIDNLLLASILKISLNKDILKGGFKYYEKNNIHECKRYYC